MSSSTPSCSFRPPAPNSLMPLSMNGLWLAEMTAPAVPSCSATKATAGDGATPSRRTSTPADVNPAMRAASSIGPDRRVSRPTTMRSMRNTLAEARATARATSAVSSVLATPRMPSVPKRSPVMGAAGEASALRVLRRLAGLLQAVLLALLLARVTRQESGLLERRPQFGVELVERPGDPHAQRPGLAARATTVEVGLDVVHLVGAGDPQGLTGDHPLGRDREVVLERPPVDRDLAGAGAEPDAGHGLLAATGCLGERLGHVFPLCLG